MMLRIQGSLDCLSKDMTEAFNKIISKEILRG